jgi:hypothetical protein
MNVLPSVERHLRDNGVSPTRFGRDALGDPRLVFDLRRGRELRPGTAERVNAYLASRGEAGE